MATTAMNESWRRVQDQITTVWPDIEFGAKEMKKARGSLNRMVDLIHEKTDEPKPDILQKISAFL